MDVLHYKDWGSSRGHTTKILLSTLVQSITEEKFAPKMFILMPPVLQFIVVLWYVVSITKHEQGRVPSRVISTWCTFTQIFPCPPKKCPS